MALEESVHWKVHIKYLSGNKYVILPATTCCSMQHLGPVSPNPSCPWRCWPHRRPHPGSSSLVKVGKRLHNPQLARHWSQFVSVLSQKFSGQRTRPWTVHWAEEVLDGGDATPPRPERGAAGWSSGRGGWGVRAGPCRGRVWLISECQLITFISNLYAEDSWHSIAGVTTFLRYPHITLYTGRVCGRSCCCPR
jgi:hypothetical protein